MVEYRPWLSRFVRDRVTASQGWLRRFNRQRLRKSADDPVAVEISARTRSANLVPSRESSIIHRVRICLSFYGVRGQAQASPEASAGPKERLTDTTGHALS